MKRFFCTVCKRVKRVRNLPYRIQPQHVDDVVPAARLGECNWHVDGRVIPPTREKYTRVKHVVIQKSVSAKRGGRK
jgi:hypothetical protein